MTYAANSVASGTVGQRVGGPRGDHNATTLDSGNHQHHSRRLLPACRASCTSTTSTARTSGVNTWHQHAFAVTSGDVSADHTHAIDLTSTGVGGGLPHSILQPSIVTNYIIWTGT